jgi:chitinase
MEAVYMRRTVTSLRRLGVLAAATTLAASTAACAGSDQQDRATSNADTTAAIAPYVDMSLASPPLVEMADSTGVTDAVLAFGLATGDRCEPSWDGGRPLDDAASVTRINELHEHGGRITVATGGAHGPYLENTCGSAGELAAAYGRLLDATGADGLDVDIEADIPTDTVVAALKQVQQEHGTPVSLTLRVAGQDEGLERSALAQVRAADAAGVRFTVNAMIMNFPYQGTWRQAMLGALRATESQLATVWPGDEVGSRLAMTAMIGRTDTGPVTTIDDARALAAEAVSRGLGEIRFWSLGRDNGGCDGATTTRPDCSGTAQSAFAYTSTFRDAVRVAGITTSTNGRNTR